MIPNRVGIAVWLNHLKMARHLRRIGNVHYISKKMRYAILYVNKEQLDDTIARLEKLNYVKRVEVSHRHELKTEFQAKPDKVRGFNI